jgi:hypothetical protein
LHEKTRDIVLIIDSCNSGTATRGDSGLVARFFEPAPPGDEVENDAGDGVGGWGSASLPGLIAFTAAGDGTPALERNGRGIFTDALVTVLAAGSGSPLTYAQVARQVAPLVAASSYQIPYFQGNLQRNVFASDTAMRPLGWDVVSAGTTIELSGAPLPGIGVGAEFSVFDGAASGVLDPSEAKATVVVTEFSGVNAVARISQRVAGAPDVAVGDLAKLVRPSDDFLKIRVSLRPAEASGGVAAGRAGAIRDAIASHPETRTLVDLVDRGGEFEISTAFDGRLILRGPENRIRNTYDDDAAVADSLWQHARQRALLQLRGEGGRDFVDHETLAVRLVPAPVQSPCADGEWVQAEPNREQVVPLCHAWNVEVSLAADSPRALMVGALILSTDGSTYGLPADGRTVVLQPGETTIFNSSGETFRGTPPLDTRDNVLVFGTQQTNPVPWHLLSETAAVRGTQTGTLARALDRYLRPGTRGASPAIDSDPTTWTMSNVAVRVEANSRFLEPRAASSEIQQREYTLRQFDIRPYLPDDPDSALSRVLRQAHELANASAVDGFGYAQHDWSQPTDEANLSIGIDCSRALWYTFTRSGLPYNRDDRYLHTGLMVGDDSIMSDEFVQCPLDEGMQLGDILVYRSDSDEPGRRNTGHTVMVIDAEKRIAWGSHGWDGEGRQPDIDPDTGVEYQLIKFKPDWQRWDRSDMSLKACWRYNVFIEEAENGRGVPGAEALSDPCQSGSCPL